MKNLNKNPNIDCENIRGLLIKKSMEKLTSEESLLVENHLKSCQGCLSYQNTLLNLENSMRAHAKEKPVPDPAIRRNIVRQMKIRRAKDAGIFKTTWQYIRAILGYRIPVYQALFSVALILVISLGVKQLPFPTEKKSPEQIGFAQMNESVSSQLNVIESLKIIEKQKIGRTAQEDSSLTQFIVSTR